MIKVERYQTGSKGRSGRKGRLILKVVSAFLLMFLFAIRSDKKIMQPVLALELKVKNQIIKRTVFLQNVLKYKFSNNRLMFVNSLIYLDDKYQPIHKMLFGNHFFVENGLGYSVYEKLGESIKSYDASGKLIYEVKTKGYPMANRNPRYLPIMLADQASLKFYDQKSDKIVDGVLHFSSIITGFALDIKTNNYYLSLLDGRLIKGKVGIKKSLWSKSLAASRISLIKGLFLSENGKLLVVLSGIDPERYTLISTTGKGLWSIRTGGSRRSFTSVQVGKKFCFGYTDKYIYILDLKNGDFVYQTGLAAIEKGKISFASFAENKKGFVLASYSVGKKSSVILLNPKGRLLFRKEYNSTYCKLSFSENGSAFRIQTQNQLEVYIDLNAKENTNAK